MPKCDILAFGYWIANIGIPITTKTFWLFPGLAWNLVIWPDDLAFPQLYARHRENLMIGWERKMQDVGVVWMV